MSTVKDMRPFAIELAAMFAAGYVVGKYTQMNVPTIAEARELIQQDPTIDPERLLKKKPFVSYSDNTISINLGKRGR